MHPLLCLILVFLAELFPGRKALANSPEFGQCYGDEKSRTGVLFFHGLNDLTKSNQENTEALAVMVRVAAKLSFRLAAPKAKGRCFQLGKEKSCWKAGSSEEIRSTLNEAIETSSKCFKNSQPLGVVGFSNGAWFVNKLVANCLKNPFQWIISVAGGGNLVKGQSIDESCGRLTLAVGNRDRLNKQGVLDFYRDLKGKVKVDLSIFSGGHSLYESSMYEILKDKVNSK